MARRARRRTGEARSLLREPTSALGRRSGSQVWLAGRESQNRHGRAHAVLRRVEASTHTVAKLSAKPLTLHCSPPLVLSPSPLRLRAFLRALLSKACPQSTISGNTRASKLPRRSWLDIEVANRKIMCIGAIAIGLCSASHCAARAARCAEGLQGTAELCWPRKWFAPRPRPAPPALLLPKQAATPARILMPAFAWHIAHWPAAAHGVSPAAVPAGR